MTVVDALFEALDKAGIEARFVGGCVRDKVLGLADERTDVDFAVNKPPEAVTKALEAADIKVVPTGIKHGTVTAIVHGRPFELTTLRRDVETDGRHAVVAFTDDWREDASRRDFTFNALYADRAGTIYDYFDGQTDLKAGRVRFIGDPEQRIAEDRLRVLRFFRFHARFGKPPFDGPSFDACRRNAATVSGLSGERVRKEPLRTLDAPGDWRAALALAGSWTPPDLPIGGNDALALGLKPGPKVGALIEAVERWWIAGDFLADRDACLAELKRLADAPSS